jgi:hypothetical protein
MEKVLYTRDGVCLPCFLGMFFRAAAPDMVVASTTEVRAERRSSPLTRRMMKEYEMFLDDTVVASQAQLRVVY